MAINFKSMLKKEQQNYKKTFLVSLMAVLLISSLAIGIFAGQAMGQSTVHVGTDAELKNAVNNAADGVQIVIALDKNIALTEPLTIPANKDIALKSNSNSELFKLFGASGQNTIIVTKDGLLRLDGITVTHASGATGLGISVASGGTLIMSGGEICNNTYIGVSNSGNFSMSGGKISNTIGGTMQSNGGVYNTGTFSMSGGEISGNNVTGVSNSGTFSMSGGKISDNAINSTFAGNTGNSGGGVLNTGTFSLSGGEISGNSAFSGSGVSNSGTFSLSGGKISDNTFRNGNSGGGGGVYNTGTFSLSGGEISGNTANWGGGVDNVGKFNMSSGTISNNKASNTESGGGGVSNSGTFNMSGGSILNNMAANGGGVYVASKNNNNGVFNLSGGRISGNTASKDGGGIWVNVGNLFRVFVSSGVVFSNNRASVAYNRDSAHNDVYGAYIGNDVTWTSPFTQGYNNYDISYTSGTIIAGTEFSPSEPPAVAPATPTPTISGGSNNNNQHGGNDGSHNSGNTGQNTNNNELSTTRLVGALGVTLFFMLLIIMAFKKIIAAFGRSVKRKVAEIDENKLELPKRVSGTPVCWSAVSIKKLNIMLKRVFGDEYPQLKSIKTKTANVILTLCILPSIFILVFIFVIGILLNPAVYTAIFNLDFAALGTVFAEGLSAIGMFDVDLLFWVFMAPLFGFIIYCLIMLNNTYWGILGTREQIWVLVKYYNIHAYDYKYSCGVSVFSSGDIVDNQALALLIECHNNNGEYANRTGYTEYEGHDWKQADEGHEREEYENQNVQEDPFVTLGVSEDATEDEVKKAYQELMNRYHTDKHRNDPRYNERTAKAAAINDAYDKIKEIKQWGKYKPK